MKLKKDESKSEDLTGGFLSLLLFKDLIEFSFLSFVSVLNIPIEVENVSGSSLNTVTV